MGSFVFGEARRFDRDLGEESLQRYVEATLEVVLLPPNLHNIII